VRAVVEVVVEVIEIEMKMKMETEAAEEEEAAEKDRIMPKAKSTTIIMMMASMLRPAYPK
jgi:hypothetical protein